MDKNKIGAMINKQLLKIRDKMRYDCTETSFPLQFKIKYPDKWKKINESPRDFYKFVSIVKKHEYISPARIRKDIGSDSINDIFYQSRIQRISQNSIYDLTRKVLHLHDSNDDEITYWIKLIEKSYYCAWRLSDTDVIEHANFYPCKYDKNIFEKKYYYYKSRSNILGGYFTKLVKFMLLISNWYEKDIVEFDITKEIVEIMHNFNYYDICCKLILNNPSLVEIKRVLPTVSRGYGKPKLKVCDKNGILGNIKKIIFKS